MSNDPKVTNAELKYHSTSGDVYETPDGSRYRVTDKYGHAVETERTKRVRLEREKAEHKREIERQERENYRNKVQDEIESNFPRVTFLDFLLSVAAASLIFAITLVIFAVFAVSYSLTALWPQYISQLIGSFAQGTFIIPTLIVTAAVVFIIGFLVFCIHRTVTTKEPMAKLFGIVTIAAYAVPYIFFDLLIRSFSITSILIRLFNGALFAVLPTVILACVEYKVNGGEHLVRRIAQAVCKGKGGLRLFFGIVGVIMLIMAIVYAVFLMPYAGIIAGVGGVAAYALGGVFLLLVAINGKN